MRWELDGMLRKLCPRDSFNRHVEGVPCRTVRSVPVWGVVFSFWHLLSFFLSFVCLFVDILDDLDYLDDLDESKGMNRPERSVGPDWASLE